MGSKKCEDSQAGSLRVLGMHINTSVALATSRCKGTSGTVSKNESKKARKKERQTERNKEGKKDRQTERKKEKEDSRKRPYLFPIL